MKRAHRLGAVGLVALAFTLGCDEARGTEPPLRTSEPRASAPRTDAPRTDAPRTNEPRTNEARTDETPPTARRPEDLPAAPASGCTLEPPVRVHAGAWASVAALDGAFYVLGTAPEGTQEVVFVARVTRDRAVETVAEVPLEHAVPATHRRATPAIAASASELAIALADGQRRIVFGTMTPTARSLRLTPIGTDASLRFAPSLAPQAGSWAITWTEERDEAPLVRAGLHVGGALRATRELRPDAGGGTASTLIRGGSAAVLLDARAGVSVVHRAAFDERGFANATIARPLNLVTEPPELAAVRVGAREWLAYTAIGSVATTAVGLVPLDGTTPPVPLVAGTGYGVLHVDAAPLGATSAVLVADAPQASPPESPREVHVRTLDDSGALGEATIVRGPGGAASRGRVAHAGEGSIGVSFSEAGAIYLTIGRCAY